METAWKQLVSDQHVYENHNCDHAGVKYAVCLSYACICLLSGRENRGSRSDVMMSDVPEGGGASMTANEARDARDSQGIEIWKVEVQNVSVCNRPCHWSWYRTVFD